MKPRARFVNDSNDSGMDDWYVAIEVTADNRIEAENYFDEFTAFLFYQIHEFQGITYAGCPYEMTKDGCPTYGDSFSIDKSKCTKLEFVNEMKRLFKLYKTFLKSKSNGK